MAQKGKLVIDIANWMTKSVAARAISLLWLGTIINSGLALGAQIVLARILGPNGFGTFYSALITINLVAPVVAFGIPTFWLRVFGEEAQEAKRWLLPSYKIFFASSICAMVLVVLWAEYGVRESDLAFVLITLAPTVAAQGASSMLSAKFQLEGRFAALAIWEGASSFFRLVILLVFAVMSVDLQKQQQAIAFSYLFIAACLSFFAGKKLFFSKIDVSRFINSVQKKNVFYTKANVPNVLRQSWKFGLSAMLYITYYQVGVLMLKNMSDATQAGLYGAAYLIVGATYTLPGVVFQKYLLPKVHKWQFTNTEYLQNLYKYGTLIMGLLGILATLSAYTMAAFGLTAMFGKEYEMATPILLILSLAIPFRYASTSAAAVLVSDEMLSKKVKLMIFAVILNATMNYMFIPLYGAFGAAWTTVTTEAFMFAFLCIIAIKNFSKKSLLVHHD